MLKIGTYIVVLSLLLSSYCGLVRSHVGFMDYVSVSKGMPAYSLLLSPVISLLSPLSLWSPNFTGYSPDLLIWSLLVMPQTYDMCYRAYITVPLLASYLSQIHTIVGIEYYYYQDLIRLYICYIKVVYCWGLVINIRYLSKLLIYFLIYCHL